MTPLQMIDLPDRLPFAGVVEGVPDIVVQLGLFALVTAAVLVGGVFIAAPLVRALAARLGVHERLQRFLVNATKVLTVPAALLVGLLVAGFGLAAMALGAVGLVLLLGISLAADALVRDLVAGVFLLVTQPFEHGDWIETDDVEGRVEHVGVRMTTVRTFDNETVTVPNATLNEQAVTNRSAQPKLRQSYRFGIAYDEDFSTAMEAVELAAREVEGIAAEPAPAARAIEIEPSWITLRATVWLENPSRLEYIDTRSRFIRAVKAALLKNEIDINPEKTELSGQVGTVELDSDDTAVEREYAQD